MADDICRSSVRGMMCIIAPRFTELTDFSLLGASAHQSRFIDCPEVIPSKLVEAQFAASA